ncbi:MAG TPA: hypothetical protein VMD08_10610, partial [Candidatus Baltobacteraceae bacterium]|nr:hypothetical protein [Candidatus Baltobacteraceae bacterium]
MPNIPPQWEQVNEDGFGHPLNPAYEDAALFSFDGHLYANTEHGILRLGSPRTKRWGVVPVPLLRAQLNCPVPLGGHLYLRSGDGSHLWRAAAGTPITSQASWTSLTSLTPLPNAPHPRLMTIFGNQLYGIHWSVDP